MFYNTFQGIALEKEDLKEVLEKGLYPCVGLQSQDGVVEVNFNHKKFKYAGNLFLMISDFPLFNLFYFNNAI